jgi:hypothetical protein
MPNRENSKSQYNKMRAPSWIGRQPPRTWAILYVLMVPIAGLVFWTLPAGSFYDGNLTKEAGYKSDISTVTRLLTVALKDQESGDYPASHLAAPRWQEDGLYITLDRSSVYVLPGSLQVSDTGNLEFAVRGSANSPQNATRSLSTIFTTGIELSNSTEYSTLSKTGSLLLSGYDVEYSAGASTAINNPPLSALFPSNNLLPPSTPTRYEFWAPPSTASVIERLSTAAQGDPKDASGLYIRMCYFSAITITTLGFGDITPITSAARLLVGIEAVLGVVVVGLFLNAIARKWSESS